MFWNQYPYINLNDLNLDFLLKAIGEMQNEVKNFVTLNEVKYADPIQWDITSQYEKNTIVINPLTGTAYISVQPVPSGVALNRTEYWTPVFDLSFFITQGNANLTEHVEGAGVIYSTFALNENDWVIWNGILYKALVNMPIGTAYSVDGNIERVTVEEYIKDILTAIANEVQARIDADDALNIKIGELSDLATTDKTNVVNAINEAVQDASNIDTKIGELSDLTTTDKTNIVNAINEVNTSGGGVVERLNNLDVVNVKDFGAVGDDITDDTDAIKAAAAVVNSNGGILYFPVGSYVISDTIVLTGNKIRVSGVGVHATYIKQNANKSAFKIENAPRIYGIRFENITCIYIGSSAPSNTTRGLEIINAINSTFNNMLIQNFHLGIHCNNVGNSFFTDIGVTSSWSGSVGYNVGNASVSNAFKNCWVGFMNDAAVDSYGITIADGRIADNVFDYIDIANGAIGVLIDGSDGNSDTTNGADIRLKDIVIDGTRNAGIQINNINEGGNIVIDGGWINPLATNGNKCIQLTAVNNVEITNMIMQQLDNSSPLLIGVLIGSASFVNINNCQFINMQNAINATTVDKLSIQGNIIRLYVGKTSSSGGVVVDNALNTIVNANNIYGNHGFGVLFGSTGDYSIITNNIITGATTPITDPHTNNVIANNLT